MKSSIKAIGFSTWMVLSLCMNVASAVITTRPQDTEAAVGKSASFECATTLVDPEIQWYHYALGSTEKSYVFAYGAFRVPYLGRVRADPTANSPGVSRIIISEVVEQDAGIYECQEDAGTGNSSHASLTVLHSEPVCESNLTLGEAIIGPNSCGFTPEVLQLSCSVNYTGTNPPQLVWVKTGESVVIRDGVAHGRIGNTVISNLTLEGRSQLDGQSFTCQTTKPSASQKFTCSSGQIKVWHATNSFTMTEKAIGENVSCTNGNLPSPCSYTWIRADNKGEAVAANGPTFKPDAPGLYRCQADCTVKGKPCSISVELVHVAGHGSITEPFVAPEDGSNSFKPALIAVVIILGLLLIAFIVAFVCFVRFRKKNQRHKNGEEREMLTVENKNKTIADLEKKLSEATVKDAGKTEETEKRLAGSQAQWAKERDVLLKRLNELKNGPAGMECSAANVPTPKIQTEASKDRGKSIKGLALLNNEIYVFSQTESKVEIYDATILQRSRGWELTEMTEPEDAVACTRKRCIYVSESKANSKILRVDSNGKLIKQWPTQDSVGRLSVSVDSNVIVAIHDSHKIKEFSSEGEQLREFDLKKFDMHHPMHAIKVRNGNFIVTHGYLDDTIHRVCQVDFSSNQMLKFFGSRKGGGNSQMSNPTYLGVDRNGSILVADAGNARVILLGSSFEFKKELISKDGANGPQVPTRILLDELNGRLFVGDYKSKNSRLFIFGTN